jgi:DNA repair protein RadC
VSNPIKAWPVDDRPREKLFKLGEHKLSNAELLAILLRDGSRGESALDLSRLILQKFKTFRNMSHIDSRDWLGFRGLGQAKIAQIKAAIEIGRRFNEEQIVESRPKIRFAKDVVDMLMPRMRDLKKEVFKVIFLNSQNRVIAIEDVEEGTVNHAVPIVREIFQRALQHFSVSIICVHNHPSGVATPSIDDEVFTARLFEAGEIMQIKVLDSIIIANNDFYSFEEKLVK